MKTNATVKALVEQALRHKRNSVQQKQYDELKTMFYKSFNKIQHDRTDAMLYNNKEALKALELLFICIMLDKKVYQLMKNLENKDEYSFLHSLDVFLVGTLFGTLLEVDDIFSFAKGCLLHDIGKLKVPKNVLTKKGRLTDEEYDIIKNHSMWGFEILKNENDIVKDLAKNHHEKQNGKGYPEKLSQSDIPFNAQILTVIDVFSALSLKRSYKEVIEVERSLDILLEDIETIFNPSILLEFITMVRVKEKEKIESYFEVDVVETIYSALAIELLTP